MLGNLNLNQNRATRGDSASYSRSHSILQKHSTLLFWFQLLIDVFIASGLLYVLTLARGNEFDFHYRILLVATLLLMWIVYNSLGIYRRYTDNYGVFIKLVKAWGIVVVGLVLIGFLTKTSMIYSRQVILTWAVSCFLLQLAAHIIFPLFLKNFRSSQKNTTPALLVGAGNLGRFLANSINGNPWLPIQIVGVVDDDEQALSGWDVDNAPVLGAIADIGALLEKFNIETVYIAMPISESAKIETLYLELLSKNVNVNWAPDLFGMILVNHNIKEIAGVPVLALSETPLIGASQFAKSVLDKVLASVAILVFSPIMLATAIAVKLSSPGPVMFKQKRHGWNGSVFEVYKFRSMRLHKENSNVTTQAVVGDLRVTAVGRFIRSTSIDELPQLFNVLEGKMSLVGPRPHAVAHDNYYSQKISSYFARHRIKPGMTGLAQVNGCRGETETIGKMQERIQYDLDYINNWSIMLDLKILFKTTYTLVSKKVY